MGSAAHGKKVIAMTAVMQRESKHRIHDAVRHVPGANWADRMLHEHSPVQRYTVRFDHLDTEMTEQEMVDELEYYGPR
jgi:hypothetical protein